MPAPSVIQSFWEHFPILPVAPLFEKSAGTTFKATYSEKLEEFLEWNDSCASPEGDTIRRSKSCVSDQLDIPRYFARHRSGLHTSYCPDDDNPNPRATIRLSNQKLREEGTWNVLQMESRRFLRRTRQSTPSQNAWKKPKRGGVPKGPCRRGAWERYLKQNRVM
ncbi:hypothetical protein V8E54_005001 [Elaphomyces granulatus]